MKPRLFAVKFQLCIQGLNTMNMGWHGAWGMEHGEFRKALVSK